MWKGLLLVGVSILPLQSEAACTPKSLQGRYVAMFAGEFSGFWQRCNVRVNSRGFATGRCEVGTGDIGPMDPIQFSVSPGCFVSGNSESGVFSVFLRVEPHRRGMTGRFTADDGVTFFEGPVVAVKRGK